MAAFSRGDYASAERFLRPLAEAGNPVAQTYLGTIYMGGGGGKVEIGSAWLNKAANSGSAVAQGALGLMYLNGIGTARDPKQAAAWFLKAAEQDGADGSTDAQLELGRLYERGFGVPRDDAEARKWLGKAAAGFRAAAKHGDIHSQLALATMYQNGEGGARDARGASALFLQVASAYRKAAEQGDSQAQVKLARMYQSGHGLPRSRVQAAIWLRRAADQGDADAQLRLGMLYQEPFGLFLLSEPDDSDKSYIWFSLAASGTPGARTEVAAQARDAAAKGLSADQLAEADRFIRQWRPLTETPGPNGSPVQMSPAQRAEAERLRREWEPTPEEVAAIKRSAENYDVVLGSAAAKLRIIEYVSLSSPMAAKFYVDVLPQLKAKYINTGLVQLVFRDLQTTPVELATDAALLAHCDGGKRYFDVSNAIFHSADTIRLGNPRSSLREATRSIGLSDEAFDRCLADKAERDAVNLRTRTFAAYYGVQAAPTFIVGNQKWLGIQSLARMQVAISRALGEPVEPTGGWNGHDPRFLRGFFIRAIDKEAGDDPGEKPPSQGDERFPQATGRDLWLRGEAVIAEDMITEASVGDSFDGRPAINFRMTEKGRQRFADFSAANVGRPFAIVWNGVVISSPMIEEPITGGSGQIVGEFSVSKAKEIAKAISHSKTSAQAAN